MQVDRNQYKELERGMNMEKRNAKHFMAVFAAAFIICLTLLFSGRAMAATSYKALEYGKTVHVGNYYLKIMENSIMYSTRKNGTYTTAKLGGYEYSAYSDGKYLVTVERTTTGALRLVKVTLKSGKVRILKKLPLGKYQYDAPWWHISGIYGSNVFLTRGSFEQWNYKTYVYNLSTGKYTKAKNNCSISFIKGKYAVAATTYQTDVSAHPRIIYKISSDGSLKKVKKLGNYIGTTVMAGKKLYFTKYTDTNMSKLTICRCNIDGTQVEKLGTFKKTGEYGQVIAYNITSEGCSINNSGTNYTYNFETKKLTPAN